MQNLKVALLPFAIYNPAEKLLAGGVAGQLCITLCESTVVGSMALKLIGYVLNEEFTQYTNSLQFFNYCTFMMYNRFKSKSV